jgi:hypothetical protein
LEVFNLFPINVRLSSSWSPSELKSVFGETKTANGQVPYGLVVINLNTLTSNPSGGSDQKEFPEGTNMKLQGDPAFP